MLLVMKTQAQERAQKKASARPANHPSDNFAQAVGLIRKGYSKGSVAELADKLRVSREQLVHAVGLSARTIRGRKDRLTPLETDRLVRLEKVFEKACEVLGSEQEAADWMTQPAYGFGGIKPLDMLDTEVGTREVFNLLGSIESGQYY